MDEKQYKEFSIIVKRCKQERTSSINVPRLVWGDAIIAAWEERGELRELLREAVILFECDDECSDPSTAAWGWLQDARTELEGVCWNE